MRVIIVGHSYVTKVMQGKLNALVDETIEVGLILPKQWNARAWNVIQSAHQPKNSPIKFFPINVFFNGSITGHLYSPLRIAKILHSFQPNVIHIDAEVFSIVAFELIYLAKVYRIPVLVSGPRIYSVQHLNSIQKFALKGVLREADSICVGSKGGHDRLVEWGYNGIISKVQPFGVDETIFYPKARNNSNCEDSLVMIGFIGRIVPEKGIETLLRSVREIARRKMNSQFILKVYGSGESEQEFKALSVNIGVSHLVQWEGFVDHDTIAGYIRDLDIVVLPSITTPTWREMFGVVLIQAMASGVAVVGSDSGAIPDVIGRSDVIFKEGDYYDLANILESLVNSKSARDELGDYGLRHVKNHYTYSMLAQQLTAVYFQLLAQHTSKT